MTEPRSFEQIAASINSKLDTIERDVGSIKAQLVATQGRLNGVPTALDLMCIAIVTAALSGLFGAALIAILRAL